MYTFALVGRERVRVEGMAEKEIRKPLPGKRRENV